MNGMPVAEPRRRAGSERSSAEPSVLGNLRELYARRDLLVAMTLRHFKARYRQAVFGCAWAVLQPFALMVVFTFVFGRLARIPSDGIPYPIFSYSALVFWTFFATTVSQATPSLVSNANLVKKMYFPREIIPVSVMLGRLIDLGVAFVILVAMMLYFHVPITLHALWVIPLLVIQILFTTSVILLTSALNVRFRDIGHAIPLLMQVWMFLTPVAYPLSLLAERQVGFHLLNPMTPVIDGYRSVLLKGSVPDLATMGFVTLAAVTILAGSYLYFKRAELTFADVI